MTRTLLPADSLQALDWLNFFLAALLMGFGPFVTVYLADRGWTPESERSDEGIPMVERDAHEIAAPGMDRQGLPSGGRNDDPV